ncbi:MAG: response regulator [Polyangiaceae bacterium]|nr:response regulator [Polyangiaceae bacterium]
MASQDDLFVVLDRQGAVVRYGAELGRIAGWSPSVAMGRPISELVVPLEPTAFPRLDASDQAIAWRGLVALAPVEGHGPSTFVASLTAEPGAGEIWLGAEAVPKTGLRHLGRSGEPAATPIDAGGAAPTVLTAKSLIEAPDSSNMQLLGLILGHLPGFCYSLDANLVFTSSVGAGLRSLSLAEDQIVGTRLYDLYGTRDPTYEPLACHFRALAGFAQTYQDVCMGRSLEYHVRPLRDPNERIVGVVGVAQDVTEREALKEALATVHSQLRQAQKLETIGQLAGGVAHDFNNQLTCILGNLTLAQQHLPPGSRGVRHLTEAAGAAESAAALTRHLLALGRKQLIEPRPLDLSALVHRVQGMLRRLLEAGITLVVENPGTVCPVFADPGQLEQVLINLVVNARDAIAEHGRITIGTERHDCTTACDHPSPELDTGHYVVLFVRDDGCGMSDAVRARVFEPYFTTKPLGEGTGLGLATVFGVVQQNHGTVSVESALGRGSLFRIYLPRLADDAALASSAPGSRSGRNGGTAELPHGTETILLVDDEPLVLEVAQCTLQQLGYEVLACAHADDALRRFEERERHVDLLVTDVVMPRLNGRELAARVAALKPGIPILFTSGYGESIIARHGKLDPAVQFLAKPYRPHELAAKVRGLLDGVARSAVSPTGT